MSQEWSAPAWAVVAVLGTVAALLLLLLGALVVVVVTTRRTLARTDAESAVVLDRLLHLEQTLAARPVPEARTEEREYLITHLGEDDPDERGDDRTGPAPMLPAPVFADMVLRETAVQATTLAAGLRRALSPEVRHRIRFEMRREVKRARKQRRADLRAARRDLHARQRAAEQAA
ncbi:hypothetical protein NOMA109596_02930 [Nocardioides marinus]|uniref:Uncharacterized protein n=1 Tax=Nocardioides marinus TaxID=374514 RepID=A0A7Y9YE83_9ACTN|nr:hypothetical protein [Nocardioides marinus]NYI10019.1 hypothetical protein [Nocardioides marinus]